MKCIIMDVDGTLADVRHRLHHLKEEPKDWVAFHDAMVDDKPIAAIAWLAQALTYASMAYQNSDDPFEVLIVSARHEDYRERTMNWLLDHDIQYNKLYLRSNDDRRPDHQVKEDILAQILEDGYEPFLVIDDRPEVAEMWRRYGICVLQADYEELSKYEGKNLLTLLVGPAGAGKSSYAFKHFEAGEVISTDKIREQEGLGHTQDDLALTFKLARGYAKTRIECGLHTVIDATNLKQKDRLAFVRLAPITTTVRYILIDRDYDDKVRMRGWRPVELIDKHHRQFKAALPDLLRCDDRPNVYIEDKRA